MAVLLEVGIATRQPPGRRSRLFGPGEQNVRDPTARRRARPGRGWR